MSIPALTDLDPDAIRAAIARLLTSASAETREYIARRMAEKLAAQYGHRDDGPVDAATRVDLEQRLQMTEAGLAVSVFGAELGVIPFGLLRRWPRRSS